MKIEDLPELIPGKWYMISYDYRNLGRNMGEEFPVRLIDFTAGGLFDYHFFDWPEMRSRRNISNVQNLLTCRALTDEEVKQYRQNTETVSRAKLIADLDSNLKALFD